MKNTSATLPQTLALVTKALAHTEEILRAEYERQLVAQKNTVLKELAEDGWDARKRYGFPYGSQSKREYMMQRARYSLCQELTESAERFPRGGMNAPDPRKPKADNWGRLAEKAEKLAKDALEGYCMKLAMKIDATGIAALKLTYEGGLDPWGWSYLKVNDDEQTWKTQMIVNVSCLGKVFNQWPTRLMS